MEKPTEQKFEVSTPGQTTPSIVRIVTETSEQLTRSYERLKWLGFISMSGGLMVLLSFVFTIMDGSKFQFNSQVLYTVVGFCMLLLSAALFALQNTHSFRIENRNRDFALRSLELGHVEKKTILDQPAAAAPAPYVPPSG